MEVLHKEVPWLKVMFHSAGPAPLAIETALSYPALVFPILANLSPKPFSLLSPYSRLMLCVMYVLGVLQLEHYDFPDDLGPAIAIPTHGKSLVERRALLHRHLEKVMKRTFPFDEPRESCWPESLTHPQNGRKNANWLSTAKFTEPSGRREDIAAGTSASDAMDVDEARTPPAVLPELPEIEDEVMEVEMPGGAPPVLSGPLGLEGLEDGAAQAAGLPPSDVPQVPQPVDLPAPPAPVPVGHPPSSPAVSVNPPPPYALTDRTPDPASSAQPSRALSPVVEEPGGPRASPGAGGLPVPSEAGGSPTKAPRRRRDRSASVTAPEVELRRQDRTRKEVLAVPPSLSRFGSTLKSPNSDWASLLLRGHALQAPRLRLRPDPVQVQLALLPPHPDPEPDPHQAPVVPPAVYFLLQMSDTSHDLLTTCFSHLIHLRLLIHFSVHLTANPHSSNLIFALATVLFVLYPLHSCS